MEMKSPKLVLILVIAIAIVVLSFYLPLFEKERRPATSLLPLSKEETVTITPPAENLSVTGKEWVEVNLERDYKLSLYHSLFEQTSDGGYIAVGTFLGNTTVCNFLGKGADYCGSIPDYRAYLLKLDANGNMQWNKTYEDVHENDTLLGNNSMLGAFSVEQTSDNGYVIAAEGIPHNVTYLIRTDSNGNLIWKKPVVVCEGKCGNRPFSVKQTTKGELIIVGSTIRDYSPTIDDAFLVKTDADGNKIWGKIYDGPDHEELRSVYQTPDGGYIAFGYKYSKDGMSNETEIYLIKTDANGNMVWDRTHKPEMYLPNVYFVQQTSDGEYLITFPGRDYVFKIDENGEEVFLKSFTVRADAYLLSIRQTSDDKYIAAVDYSSPNAGIYLIKFDEDGNKLWTKMITEKKPPVGEWWLQQTADGGYIIIGRGERARTYVTINGVAQPPDVNLPEQFFLIKTDEGGNV